jgi:hypothetical protein
MALDLSAIRGRLNKLQNTSKKTDSLWKPSPGKHQVRIVPYKFSPENPFIELFFHYGINNKTYLSPSSFGRPDPIVEFAEKLKRMGDKEDWKAAKKMEPKLRTFVPVLVRGEESEGIKFWGFGKTVYQEILGYIADPDYGDITDSKDGRDITIEYISAEDAGTSYPVTTIRVKPNVTPLAADDTEVENLLQNQSNITDIYQELSYDELKNVLEGWLNPTGEDDGDESVSTQSLSTTTPSAPQATTAPTAVTTPQASVPAEDRKKLDDVASAFDDLFNN